MSTSLHTWWVANLARLRAHVPLLALWYILLAVVMIAAFVRQDRGGSGTDYGDLLVALLFLALAAWLSYQKRRSISPPHDFLCIGPTSRPTPGSDERARALLLSALTPEQREQLLAARTFDVVGSRGTRYRLYPRGVYNVIRLEDGSAFCAVPRGILPLDDTLLAQKLWLESDERAFLRAANKDDGVEW